MQKPESTSPAMIKLRIRIARLRAGFVQLQDAARYIDEHEAIVMSNGRPVKERAYVSYERAERTLSPRILEQIEKVFKVAPKGWLQHGKGETEMELRREVMRLEAEARRKTRQSRIPAPSSAVDLNGLVTGEVNQLTANNDDFPINPSQIVAIRRIPILSGNDVTQFRAGKRDFPMGRTLILPQSDTLTETTFGYQIPYDDHSMAGADGLPFPAGMECTFDSAREIQPGDFLLIRPKGMAGWLFRQYQAGLPISMAKEFTLRAINPSVEPIRVTDPENWEIGGRLTRTVNHY